MPMHRMISAGEARNHALFNFTKGALPCSHAQPQNLQPSAFERPATGADAIELTFLARVQSRRLRGS
eukprot:scaffold876_cov243-Pinguiococcus_pyrenoidosus.AAC.18